MSNYHQLFLVECLVIDLLLTLPCWAFSYSLVFVMVNSATLDIVHFSCCIYIGVSINYIPNDRIAVSQGRWMPNSRRWWLHQFIFISAVYEMKNPLIIRLTIDTIFNFYKPEEWCRTFLFMFTGFSWFLISEMPVHVSCLFFCFSYWLTGVLYYTLHINPLCILWNFSLSL